MITNRVVITGVAGFVGSSLAQYLCENGVEVIGLDNFSCGYQHNLTWYNMKKHNFTCHNIDILTEDVKNVIQKNDIVVHLAAITALPVNQSNPINSYTVNVVATLKLLEICRKKEISHFVFASSMAVYENNLYTENQPIKENAITNPSLIYSLGKKHCEETLQAYGNLYSFPYTIFRFFNLYGPSADASRTQPGLIPYLIKQSIEKKPITLYHDGTQSRDYIYISDLIRLLVVSLQKGATNTVLNASSGKVYSVNTIFSVIQNELNSSLVPIYKDPSCLWDKFPELFEGKYCLSKEVVKHDALKYTCGDNSLAKELYGWEPVVSLEEGIHIICQSQLKEV
jgi:UDP-glucose 4-epimerase